MQYNAIFAGESDCSRLLASLHTIKNKWKEFSGRLGFSQKSIQAIALTSLLDDECLKSALLAWLDGEYNQSVYGPPTLARLCAAVAHPKGGDDRSLAVEMASVHNYNTVMWYTYHGSPMVQRYRYKFMEHVSLEGHMKSTSYICMYA